MTNSKLHSILKKYRERLATHNKEWENTCSKYHNKNIKEGNVFLTPSIFEHQSHTSAGNQLFINLMKELDEVEVFPKKLK